MRRPLPIPTGSDPAEDAWAGSGRLVNAFAEPLAAGKSEMQIVAVDGLTSFATLPNSGGVRAMLDLSDGDLYVVAGRLLYRIDATGTATALGGIPSDGMVTMARNRAAVPQIAIVCDGTYYGVVGGVLSQIADPDLPPPISVTAFGGYFSFFLADGRHFASDIDGFGVDGLAFATAEAGPDGGVRNIARGSDLLFLGNRTTEAWALTGDDPYPFARTTFFEVGCLAGNSVATIDQTCAFVAHDGTVRVLEGYQARVISTREVERLIATDANPSAISATSHYGRGRTFYTLSGSTWTREYNLATGKWHDRASYGSSRWMISKVHQWGTRRIAGHRTTGTLYTIDHNAHDEAGSELVWQVVCPPVHEFPNRIIHHALTIDLVPGVGRVSQIEADLALTDDDGTPLLDDGDTTYLLDDGGDDLVTYPHEVNPQIMIDWADDGGTHFGTQIMRDLGAAGQTNRQIQVRRLGSSKNRAYRFSASAAVRRCMLAAVVDVELAGER